MANVKQARKWEALEKTYKNNNVRTYCEVKDHKKGGCGWHLKRVRGRARNSPWAALAKLSLFGGSSSGPHDRPRCGPAYRHTESVQSRWELRKEGPKSQTVPDACQQSSEREELESCLKYVSEWWSRSGKFLCKKTKWTFFLMFQIILYRILKEKKKERKKTTTQRSFSSSPCYVRRADQMPWVHGWMNFILAQFRYCKGKRLLSNSGRQWGQSWKVSFWPCLELYTQWKHTPNFTTLAFSFPGHYYITPAISLLGFIS